jgi:hypothetical protein
VISSTVFMPGRPAGILPGGLVPRLREAIPRRFRAGFSAFFTQLKFDSPGVL